MPKFTTVIPAHGSDDNVFLIIGRAHRTMRQIGLPPSEISDFIRRAMNAENYDDACNIVEEYFSVDRDES
jgi:hypothetical protein